MRVAVNITFLRSITLPLYRSFIYNRRRTSPEVRLLHFIHIHLSFHFNPPLVKQPFFFSSRPPFYLPFPVHGRVLIGKGLAPNEFDRPPRTRIFCAFAAVMQTKSLLQIRRPPRIQAAVPAAQYIRIVQHYCSSVTLSDSNTTSCTGLSAPFVFALLIFSTTS